MISFCIFFDLCIWFNYISYVEGKIPLLPNLLGNENNHLLHKMKRERKRGEKRSESYRMTKVLFEIVIRLNQQIQNEKKINKTNKLKVMLGKCKNQRENVCSRAITKIWDFVLFVQWKTMNAPSFQWLFFSLIASYLLGMSLFLEMKQKLRISKQFCTWIESRMSFVYVWCPNMYAASFWLFFLLWHETITKIVFHDEDFQYSVLHKRLLFSCDFLWLFC